MQALQNQGFLSSDSTAMDDLQDFLRRRRQGTEAHEDFAQIEQELHRLFVAAEREALGRELERFDLDVPRIEIDGERYDQVLRCETKAGPPTHPIIVPWVRFESSAACIVTPVADAACVPWS
jgi:hypothetical protein